MKSRLVKYYSYCTGPHAGLKNSYCTVEKSTVTQTSWKGGFIYQHPQNRKFYIYYKADAYEECTSVRRKPVLRTRASTKIFKKATCSFYQESTGLALTPEPLSNSSKDPLKLPEVQVEPWGTLRSIPWQSFGLSFPRQVFPGSSLPTPEGKRVSLCILRSPSSSWGLLVASARQSGMIQSL